jgi:hypothetical protein
MIDEQVLKLEVEMDDVARVQMVDRGYQLR